jgi:hypothetical protein
LTVTFSSRRGWNQAKTSLTTKFDGRVTLPLADVLDRVVQLQAQVEELTRIITVQVDVGNQTTELLGRLLATSSDRLDAVEDSLRDLTQAEMPANGSGAGGEKAVRAKSAEKPPASGDERR